MVIKKILKKAEPKRIYGRRTRTFEKNVEEKLKQIYQRQLGLKVEVKVTL
jgi:hypothetical protein